MIFDGPKKFPYSCVKHTLFRHHELQQMFAYLREYEEMLQEEVSDLGTPEEVKHVRELIEKCDDNPKMRLFRKAIELYMVQKNLLWMSHNVTGSDAERALRRRGFGSEEHIRMNKKREQWHKSAWQALLVNFTKEPKKNGTDL